MGGKHRRGFLLLFSQLDALESRLNELGAANYPSDVALAFISDFFADIKGLREEVEETRKLVDVDPEGVPEAIRNNERKINVLAHAVDWLENARTQRVPWSFISSIERIANDLAPERKVLTVGSSIPCYRILYAIDGSANKTDAYDILQIPYLHRLNSYFHILVAHELFHPIAPDFFLSRKPHVREVIRDKTTAWVKESSDIPLFTKPRIDKVVHYGVQIWEGSIKEFVCDFACYAMFGPAAIFALHDFSMLISTQDGLRPKDYHPPLIARLEGLFKYCADDSEETKAFQALLEQLNDTSSSILSSELEEIRAIVSTERSSSPTETLSDPEEFLMSVVPPLVEEMLSEAWEFAKNYTQDRNIRWISHLSEIPNHIARLKMQVPAGEVRQSGKIFGQPASISAIALAGWTCILETVSEEGDFIKHQEAFRTGRKLVLKSWEDADLKSRYPFSSPS